MDVTETVPDEEICGKAALIIAAARDAFLDLGYDAVSMDAVAKRAGVAKQTVYAHFSSKDALFLAVVKGEQRRMSIALPLPPDGGGSPEIREKLLMIGRRYLEAGLSPAVLCLFRLAVAEANRFPSLGQSIREAGARQTALDFAEFLSCAGRHGALAVPDPAIAAAHFIALVRGELHMHCLLDPAFRPTTEEIDRHLAAAIDCFMARYGGQTDRNRLPQLHAKEPAS